MCGFLLISLDAQSVTAEQVRRLRARNVFRIEVPDSHSCSKIMQIAGKEYGCDFRSAIQTARILGIPLKLIDQ